MAVRGLAREPLESLQPVGPPCPAAFHLVHRRPADCHTLCRWDLGTWLGLKLEALSAQGYDIMLVKRARTVQGRPENLRKQMMAHCADTGCEFQIRP